MSKTLPNIPPVRSVLSEKHFPSRITPDGLDQYLSKGWYRMGQSIFTTHYLSFFQDVYTALWIRQPLEGYEYPKSLRKLLRKNSQRFTHRIGPAKLSAKKDNLYSIYRKSFKGTLSPNIRQSLLDGEGHNLYNTWETEVYDGHDLIAFSFFDLGAESSASIMGVFHPDYKKYSLGLYTMALELDFSLEHSFRFFYPGYVVPGYPRFDYKLRVGSAEYYELTTRRWVPFTDYQEGNIAHQLCRRRLFDLQEALQEEQISCVYLIYPFFEANLIGDWLFEYLDHPFVLWLQPGPDQNSPSSFLFIVYNPADAAYQLYRCYTMQEIQFFLDPAFFVRYAPNEFFRNLVVVDEVLFSEAEVDTSLNKIRAILGKN